MEVPDRSRSRSRLGRVVPFVGAPVAEGTTSPQVEAPQAAKAPQQGSKFRAIGGVVVALKRWSSESRDGGRGAD